MNILLIVVIILGVVLFAIMTLLVIKGIDWRAFFVRRYGEDYRKGLAHINVNGKWLYRESELVYESDIACTYTRITATGEMLDDIVPNEIGYDYDEYTGRRQYRVVPGAIVAYSDNGDAPAVNMPSALLSTETLGRIAYGLATSVNNGGNSLNWKLIIVIAAIIGFVFVGLFLSGVIKSPGQNSTPVTTPAVTTPAPATASENITFINE